MSTYARRRILLGLAVLVIGGSGWLIAGQQRSAVIGMQGQLRASNDLLTAMLDQETGLRGYALTGDKAFLEPYVAGQRDYERSLRQARAGLDRGPVIMGLIRSADRALHLAKEAGRNRVVAAVAAHQPAV